jgi:hypothetical protein
MLSQKKFLAILSSLLLSTTWFAAIPAARAEDTIDEDSLNLQKGLKWAGDGLAFDRVLTIKDTLVNSPVGKIVISRHGHDSAPLFQLPFNGPRPGRITMLALWGAKIEGCFVRAIIHNAGVIKGDSIRSLVPVRLEMGVNGQIVKLSPNNASPRGGVFDYQYEDNGTRSANYSVTDTTFAVNKKVADLMAVARNEPVKVRVTFQNDDTQIFDLGTSSITKWKEAYSFNPSCKGNGTSAQPENPDTNMQTPPMTAPTRTRVRNRR